MHSQCVEKDESKGIQLWTRAAEVGHQRSRLFLANAFARGQGVDRDVVAALMWILLLDRDEFPEQPRHQAELEAALSPEQNEEARRRAEEWRRKIARDNPD